jgi:hypothetical protein
MFNGREVLCAEYKDQNVTHCGYIWVQKKKTVDCLCICPLFTDCVTCVDALLKL